MRRFSLSLCLSITVLLSACDTEFSTGGFKAPEVSYCEMTEAHDYVRKSATKAARAKLTKEGGADVQLERMRNLQTLDMTPVFYIHVCQFVYDVQYDDIFEEAVFRYEIANTTGQSLQMQPDMESYFYKFDKDGETFTVAVYKPYVDMFIESLKKQIEARKASS
mgnify:FL=1